MRILGSSARPLFAVLLPIVLVACSTGASPSAVIPSAAGSGAAGPIDSAAVVVGWQSTPDEIYLPLLIAIDSMKAKGYNISAQQFASTDVTFQGLASNTLQFTADSLQAAAQGVAAKVPVKIVSTRNANAVVYVANSDYKDCSKLSGKPVGIYSPQAAYTVLMNLYFEAKCPGVKPTQVTIPDSPLRAQAVAQGQIFATTLGLPDALALEQQNPGKFFMVSLGSELPGIGDEYVIANEKTITDHPSIVQALIAEQLTAVRSMYKDPASATALEKKYFPSAKDDSILQKLIADKLWYANGGLEGPGLTNTLKGFSLAGDKATLVADAPMKAALQTIGPSDLTPY